MTPSIFTPVRNERTMSTSSITSISKLIANHAAPPDAWKSPMNASCSGVRIEARIISTAITPSQRRRHVPSGESIRTCASSSRAFRFFASICCCCAALMWKLMHFFIVFDERAPDEPLIRALIRAPESRVRLNENESSSASSLARCSRIEARSAPTSSASCTSVSASPRDAKSERTAKLPSSTDCFRVSAPPPCVLARRTAVLERRLAADSAEQRRNIDGMSWLAVDERRCDAVDPRRDGASCSDSTSVVSVARAANSSTAVVSGGAGELLPRTTSTLPPSPSWRTVQPGGEPASVAAGAGAAAAVGAGSAAPSSLAPATTDGTVAAPSSQLQSLLLRRCPPERSSNETRLFGTRGGADDVASKESRDACHDMRCARSSDSRSTTFIGRSPRPLSIAATRSPSASTVRCVASVAARICCSGSAAVELLRGDSGDTSSRCEPFLGGIEPLLVRPQQLSQVL